MPGTTKLETEAKVEGFTIVSPPAVAIVGGVAESEAVENLIIGFTRPDGIVMVNVAPAGKSIMLSVSMTV